MKNLHVFTFELIGKTICEYFPQLNEQSNNFNILGKNAAEEFLEVSFHIINNLLLLGITFSYNKIIK